MENGGSDHSLPSSDSATGSLLMKFWDKESDGSSNVGLHNLVEDKDVAAKAVTLVVNSSRKGVVSLCADVASILRIKKKLEQTIELQHKELLNLRRASQVSGSGSNRTSRSTSPTPPSFNCYDSAPVSHRRSPSQKTSRQSSSRSSPFLTAPPSPSPTHSSSSSSRSHLERALSQSVASSESRDSGNPPHGHHSSAELLPNQYLVKAEVHGGPPSDSGIQDDQVSDPGLEACRAKIETSCKEVQCSSLWEENQALEKRFREVCSDKAALETDLQRARQEVDDLRKRLSTREMVQEESKICGLRIENETASTWSESSKPDTEGQSESAINLPSLHRKDHPYRRRHSSPARSLVPGSRPATTTQQPRPPSEPRTQSPPHPPAPQLLAGCLCSPCQRLQQEGARQAPPSQGHAVMRGVNHRFSLHLDDQVTTKGDKTGYVRYIGHTDKPNASHVVYAGLELDKPAGRHDGFLYGKRYFWCHHNHGLFVPLQDIVGTVKKAAKRPKTVDRSHRPGSSSGHDLRHQQGSYPLDIVPTKLGHQTASGKHLISADSTSLKQNRNLPTPSVT